MSSEPHEDFDLAVGWILALDFELWGVGLNYAISPRFSMGSERN
jgi:hypothetical protein